MNEVCPSVMEECHVLSMALTGVVEKPTRSGSKLCVSVIEQQSPHSLAREASTSCAAESGFSVCDEQMARHATNSHTKQTGNSRETPRLNTTFIAHAL